ncbi:MAG: YggS family pyridoxal phosphate-dependent enzyme [Chloroflexia bacterium]|nr:YggS family pyridoxal phosphate-dependent enzyme [Chloroflexia bacterium]
MSAIDTLTARIADAQAATTRAAEMAGREPAAVTIVAVSKMFPRSAVDAAYEAGLRVFGESRVQETRDKYELPLPGDAAVRMIGQLQTNKARQAVGLFSCIESVDRLSLVEALHRAAASAGVVVPVLVQVNIAREPQKSGCAPEDAESLFRAIKEAEHLRCDGLMTIAPLVADPSDARPTFAALRMLRDVLQETLSVPLPVLSMGMSNDYEVAIAEGATHIRLGKAIFGNR